jgi:hypothetical protein
MPEGRGFQVVVGEAGNELSVLHEEKGKEKTIMVQRQKRELYNV